MIKVLAKCINRINESKNGIKAWAMSINSDWWIQIHNWVKTQILDIKLDKLFGHYRIWIMIIKRNKRIRSILNNELWLLKWVYEIKVYSIGCEKRNLNICKVGGLDWVVTMGITSNECGSKCFNGKINIK